MVVSLAAPALLLLLGAPPERLGIAPVRPGTDVVRTIPFGPGRTARLFLGPNPRLDFGTVSVPTTLTPYAIVTLPAGIAPEDFAARERVTLMPLFPAAGLYRARSASEDALTLTDRLAPRTRFAMPDLTLPHRIYATPVPPNDPRYPDQWYFAKIGLEAAWRRSTGDPSITIAVVDTGCDLTHPDLVGQLAPGYDALDDDEDPSFRTGVAGNEHGTACAGLVGAAANNGLGIAGACPDCKISCIRLLDGVQGVVPISADVAAFAFAFEQGAAVISNSWGFAAGVPAPGPLVTAIEQVQTSGFGGRGALVVFAAGNDASVIGPDELQAIPGVLTVGALNNFDEAASFSNSGPSVALTTPIGSLTLDPVGPEGAHPGDYSASFGGTSSSCPIVAGIAGLLRASDPSLTAAEVRARLIETARPAPFATPDPSGHDPVYGFGIVNPLLALTPPGETPPDAGVPGALDAGPADAAQSPSDANASGCRCANPGRDRLGLVFVLLFWLGSRARAARRIGALFALALLAACGPPISARPTQSSAQSAPQALRPDSPGTRELPPTYDASDSVQTFASLGGHFQIHFTRSGRHAVPALDGEPDGVPDSVQRVAAAYEAVLQRYMELGFRPPLTDERVLDDHGPDERFDVYLLDFAGSADGSFRREACFGAEGCAGYMLQENDFAGYPYPSTAYAERLLASHELFHAVQARYLNLTSSVLGEGSAVWASERFDPTLSDLERFSSAYFAEADRSLGVDPIGPVQSFTYGAGLFFQFLSERYGDDRVVQLFERLDRNGGPWLEALEVELAADGGLAAALLEFSRWNLFTAGRADSARGYARGESLGVPITRTVNLPLRETGLRLAPAALRYFVAEPSGGPVAVRIDPPAATRGVVLALVRGTQIVALEEGPSDQPLPPLETAPGDRLLLALADGRASGATERVAVCLGAPETVTPCGVPAADAGTADAAAPDAGDSTDAGVAPENSAAEGCAHSRPVHAEAGRATAGSTVAVWALAAWAVLGRRRRT